MSDNINNRLPCTYIYIPFDGKGGVTMLKEHNINGTVYYTQVYYYYLNRFQDKRKIEQKEERKRKREEKNKTPQPL